MILAEPRPSEGAPGGTTGGGGGDGQRHAPSSSRDFDPSSSVNAGLDGRPILLDVTARPATRSLRPRPWVNVAVIIGNSALRTAAIAVTTHPRSTSAGELGRGAARVPCRRGLRHYHWPRHHRLIRLTMSWPREGEAAIGWASNTTSATGSRSVLIRSRGDEIGRRGEDRPPDPLLPPQTIPAARGLLSLGDDGVRPHGRHLRQPYDGLDAPLLIQLRNGAGRWSDGTQGRLADAASVIGCATRWSCVGATPRRGLGPIPLGALTHPYTRAGIAAPWPTSCATLVVTLSTPSATAAAEICVSHRYDRPWSDTSPILASPVGMVFPDLPVPGEAVAPNLRLSLAILGNSCATSSSSASRRRCAR